MREYEQVYEGAKNIGGWLIPDEEVEEYTAKRQALIDYLYSELKQRYTNVYIGGKGSEDGDYISASEGKKARDMGSVFVHFDPVEVDKFCGFEDKKEYLKELLFFNQKEYDYYQDDQKLDLEGQDALDDWQAFISKEYELEFKKEYPYPRL
ncbi:hypothetical protein [Vagococcus intermedius]|uniref:Uncharacterized protein n=1 Tax=Vagococcus intermedius TaxID=2991418 RepID=A0AAF0CW85_9ENTE|nr:hypothetical protein [Vagococcus intermedius]WEG74014.1 hypothetical protein OL234_03635 [Vagococcus intermedius]WEG76094.1 hypothetical protein OL235_03640 [Vagococcus intermedius]